MPEDEDRLEAARGSRSAPAGSGSDVSPIRGIEPGEVSAPEALPPEAQAALVEAQRAFTHTDRAPLVSPKVLLVALAAVVLLAALAFAPALVSGGLAPPEPAGSSTLSGPLSQEAALEAVQQVDPAFAGLPLRAPEVEQADWIDVLPSGSDPGGFLVEVRLDGGSFFYAVTSDGVVRSR